MRKPLTVATSVCDCSSIRLRRPHSQAPAWKTALSTAKISPAGSTSAQANMSVEDGLIRTHGGMGLLYWTGGQAFQLPPFVWSTRCAEL